MIRVDPAGRRRIEVSQFPETSRDGSQLLVQIDDFLQSCQVGLADLDGIAVCAGPGGFTRVRVACAVAQGIALGRRLPVAPVHSMQAQACALWMNHDPADPERSEPSHVIEATVLLDARMDELYAATYRVEAGHEINRPRLTTLQPPGLLAAGSIATFFDRLTDDSPGVTRLVSGDGAGRYFPLDDAARCSAEYWCGRASSGVESPEAGELALAALALAGPEHWVAASRVVPFYLREKIALTIDKQVALRAANRAVRP